MNLRANYTDTIVDLMRSSVSKGSPLNPRVWWIDPTDPVAQIIDDGQNIHLNFKFLTIILIVQQLNNLFLTSISIEYLLGENILVAPVVVEGATSRDVYLPSGIWRDENHPNSRLITGKRWLRNYPAKLDVLPWFTRVKGHHMFQ